MRQALDVAISREEMSESLAGGNPTRSFFPAETPFFYEPAEPTEPTEPAELLDAAGWTLDPETGKRTNSEGEDLELRVVAYPHRPGLPVLAGVIEETLSDLGISVDKVVTGDDWDETQTIIDGGDFDILLWAQHSLPAGDPLWFLNAFFGSGNAKNMGCYNSVSLLLLLLLLLSSFSILTSLSVALSLSWTGCLRSSAASMTPQRGSRPRRTFSSRCSRTCPSPTC